MEISEAGFGLIIIGGNSYRDDVVVRLSGQVEKRRKELSKKYYGSSHTLSEEEIRSLFDAGCQVLIIGSGQYGRVYLSREAAAFLEQEGCEVLLLPTPEVAPVFNAETRPKIGLFHLTC